MQEVLAQVLRVRPQSKSYVALANVHTLKGTNISRLLSTRQSQDSVLVAELKLQLGVFDHFMEAVYLEE